MIVGDFNIHVDDTSDKFVAKHNTEFTAATVTVVLLILFLLWV